MAASPLAKKFEALNLRERALVALAILGAAIYLWDGMFMESLRQTRMALDSELQTASASGFVAQSADLSDPRQVDLQRAGELQTQMQNLDAQHRRHRQRFRVLATHDRGAATTCSIARAGWNW